jgi:tryptophan synthase alpha subunit
MVAKVSPELKAPLVLFTYYNPIIRKGMDKFCALIKEAGASGEGAVITAQQVSIQRNVCNGELLQLVS